MSYSNNRSLVAKKTHTSRPRGQELARHEGAVRLQKILASAGFGSRRACEELITEGRVEVDRQRATLGMSVDAAKQQVRVDGESLVREKPVYYLVHKPDGYVTTNSDPEGRPRVIDLVADERRLFPVGRLDMHSEGLILVTNDGDLANRLAHPRYEIEKTYHVQVAGHVAPQEMAAIRKGVFLADGRANVERITIKRSHKNSTILEMVLAEGRNREIRRIFAGVGHKVQKLRRIAFGPLRLGEIPPGQYRMLTPQEVSTLRKVLAAPTPKSVNGKIRRKKTAGRNSSTGKRADKKAPYEKQPRKLAARGKPATDQGGGRRGRTKGRSR